MYTSNIGIGTDGGGGALLAKLNITMTEPPPLHTFWPFVPPPFQFATDPTA